MTSIAFVGFALIAFVSCLGAIDSAAHAGEPSTRADASNAKPVAAPLRVMTFNLRYGSPVPPHAWFARRPLVKALLHRHAPDLIGTQEGLPWQLDHIDADLGGDYTRIGDGRDGDGKGEHSAIYYKRARLELLDHGDFWLSDTPDRPGSVGWDAALTRMVTWGRFRDRADQTVFVAFNTHFDHRGETARRRSAELLRDRVARVAPETPVVVTGDFNAAAGRSAAYDTLVVRLPSAPAVSDAPGAPDPTPATPTERRAGVAGPSTEITPTTRPAAASRESRAPTRPANPLPSTAAPATTNSAAAVAPDDPSTAPTAGLIDTWTAAAEQSPLVATFHGYDAPVPDGDRIDWVLVRPGTRVLRAEIDTTRGDDGETASDHFPVVVDVEWPKR